MCTLCSRLGSFVYPIFTPLDPAPLLRHLSSIMRLRRPCVHNLGHRRVHFEFHVTHSSWVPRVVLVFCDLLVPSLIFFFTWPQKGLIVVVCFHVFKPASDHQNEQPNIPFVFSCASRLRTLFLLSPSLKTFFRRPSEGLCQSEPATRRAYSLIDSTLTIPLPLFRSPYIRSLGLTSAPFGRATVEVESWPIASEMLCQELATVPASNTTTRLGPSLRPSPFG